MHFFSPHISICNTSLCSGPFKIEHSVNTKYSKSCSYWSFPGWQTSGTWLQKAVLNNLLLRFELSALKNLRFDSSLQYPTSPRKILLSLSLFSQMNQKLNFFFSHQMKDILYCTCFMERKRKLVRTTKS